MPNNFVNCSQTKYERRKKYKLIRKLGYPVTRARVARDYRLSTIERKFPELKGTLGITNNGKHISTGGYAVNAAGLQTINGVVSPPCPCLATLKHNSKGDRK